MHAAIQHHEALLLRELIERCDHLTPRFARRQHRKRIIFIRHRRRLVALGRRRNEFWPSALAAVMLPNLIACDAEQPRGKAKLILRAHRSDPFEHSHEGVGGKILGQRDATDPREDEAIHRWQKSPVERAERSLITSPRRYQDRGEREVRRERVACPSWCALAGRTP